jgi:CRISPR system Cascade subunit CasB
MTKTQTPPRNRLERETKFLQDIQERIKNDTGAKAAFKRALSGEHHHLRKVYPFTLPYLNGIHEQQQDIWIFVACLSTYHNQDFEPVPRSFAQSCLDLQNSSEPKGTERRFRSLLDTDLVDIQSPITALVRQIKSKKERKISVYYPQLIADLCFWDHPDQFVQDQWARTFWGAPKPLTELVEDSGDSNSE